MLFAIYMLAGGLKNLETVVFVVYLLLFGAVLIIAPCEMANSASKKVGFG